MNAEPTLRLFLALWPDDDTRAALLARQQAQTWPATARLTRGDDLHLTLHFLGQVPQTLLPALKQALPAPCAPVALTLDRVEVWPNGVALLRNPRPYHPHAALARRARGLTPQAALPLRWTAQHYVLVHSDHGYHPL